MKNPRGMFVTTREISADGMTTKLKSGFVHQVLVLDTTEKDCEYSLLHATDSLNSMGWCTFDSITTALGKKNAVKVVKYCEEQTRKKAGKTK